MSSREDPQLFRYSCDHEIPLAGLVATVVPPRPARGEAVAFALLPTDVVSALRLILGILWLFALIGAHELSQIEPTASPAVPAAAAVTRAAGPRVDLYGNQVFEAVGDYRVDPRGEIYERHAPDTAVLRLGPPGT
jgi:hypothetical protein